MAAPPELLARVPLFAELERKDLERIARSFKERTFRRGDTVAREGQSGVGFFVIESGQARVTVGGEERRTLGPGDYFGEIALIEDTPRTATVEATSDLQCYGIVSWEFRPFVESNASIAWHMLRAMARMLRAAQASG